MDLRNKTTSEFRTVLDSPLGDPNSQVPLYLFSSEDHNRCVRFWNGLQWLDDWKKGLLYLALSSGCFVKPREVWLAVITGMAREVTEVRYKGRKSSQR